jgi:glucose/arabinose dehydrogenase
MKIKTSLLFPLLGLIIGSCTEQVPEKPEPTPPAANEIVLPEGFRATVFAEGVGPARHLTVRENGDVYVALRRLENENGIVALRDSDQDGRADQIERFGENPGTGIDIFNEYLYFGSDSTVYRYRFNGDELLPQPEPEVIVQGFPEQRQHAVKPFTFDDRNFMYVNVGAPSNACQEKMRTPGSPGLDPCPQLERQAGVWRFQADQPGQTQLEDGLRFASGIRNSVALDWNPGDRKLYVVQHGRDQLDQLWPDLFNAEQNAELPAEEFFQVDEGDDFGWPYCYFDQFQEKNVLAPEYGGDGQQTGRCESFENPILAFPGHWAPNDLLFYHGDQFPDSYKGGAFIAFHGSWNRAPLEQAGYFVAFVSFQNGEPAKDWERFADGFAGPDPVKSPGDAVYRPMGLAVGPEGALYISDSQKGRIWKVTYSAR